MKFNFFSLAFFLLFIARVFTQDGPLVSVTVSPEVLIPGIPLNLTFVIDYSDPEDVTVIAPPLPSALTMDRIVRYPMMLGTQLRTVVEYRLIPNTGGLITLGSFSIQTPQGITETHSFSLIIQNPVTEQRSAVHRLFWEGNPTGQAAAGDRITLILRAQSWTSGQPPASFFMPEVPHGVILASQNLSAGERAGGVILKLTLIPLAAGDFNLPARTLEYNDVRFEIPALHIRVNNRN